jgi:methyl-accepting chemotaxis protein
MSLGHRLTWYLLIGVLAISGLDVYFSLRRTRANLLIDVWREVDAISRTLRISLEKVSNQQPERYFPELAAEISGFENVLGVAFYDHTGRVMTISLSLQGRALPNVDVRAVMMNKTAIDGLSQDETKQRYYRVEPILNSAGEAMAAFLVIEDFPLFTRELRGRMLQAVLTILMLSIVLSAIVSIVIRQGVTQPLRMFTQRVEEIGEGQFAQRLRLGRHDEIGRLAQAFDHMCAHLDEAYRRLREEGEEKLRLERTLRHSEKLAALGAMAS